MARLSLVPHAFGALALASLVGCGGGAVCDDLAGALSGANAGETIEVGTCRVAGDVTVPEGVTVEGAGDGSVIAGQVTLAPGATLARVQVESPGSTGVLAAGDVGTVTLREVRVTAQLGVAVRIEGLGATLDDVTLVGPVTPENATDVPPMPEVTESATHGLLLIDAGSAESPVLISDLSTNGFARFGALFLDSHVRWEGGDASANLGVGVMAEGGAADLSAVAIEDTLQGIQPVPAYGGVFTGGCTLDTVDVAVNGNEGYGLLHDDAMATHVDLLAIDNGDAAVWVQTGGAFGLSGSGSRIAGNLLAGVVLVDTPTAMIRDATIDMSQSATRIEGDRGSIMVGDGIHAVLPSVTGLIIDGVTLTGNERAGILLDVADDDAGGAVMEVTVDGGGESLGAIAQGPSGLIDLGEWDSQVTRLGATAANDTAFDGVLDVVGIVAPMFLPPPSM